MLALEARVPTECHVIHAEVDVESGMPHIMPVLEHVRERAGAATEASLSAELFMSMPLCRSLLAYCAKNGLADGAEGEEGGRHALTPDGAKALESGRVVTTTTGMWKVYCADHEAIPSDMRVVRIEDGTRDAGYQPDKGADQPRAEDLEASVRALEGRELRPVLGAVSGAVVRRMHRYEKRIEPDLDLRLRIEPGREDARVTLAASLGGAPRRGRRPAVPDRAALPSIAMTLDGAMGALLRGEGDWDAGRGRLLVDYDGATAEELSSMQRTARVGRPEIGGMEFEPIEVTAKILPRSEEDARKWARRLFEAMANGYVTREEYGRLAADIGRRLPGFDIDMGDRASHVPRGGGPTGARARTRLFWLVQAMEDWGL